MISVLIKHGGQKPVVPNSKGSSQVPEKAKPVVAQRPVEFSDDILQRLGEIDHEFLPERVQQCLRAEPELLFYSLRRFLFDFEHGREFGNTELIDIFCNQLGMRVACRQANGKAIAGHLHGGIVSFGDKGASDEVLVASKEYSVVKAGSHFQYACGSSQREVLGNGHCWAVAPFCCFTKDQQIVLMEKLAQVLGLTEEQLAQKIDNSHNFSKLEKGQSGQRFACGVRLLLSKMLREGNQNVVDALKKAFVEKLHGAGDRAIKAKEQKALLWRALNLKKPIRKKRYNRRLRGRRYRGGRSNFFPPCPIL